MTTSNKFDLGKRFKIWRWSFFYGLKCKYFESAYTLYEHFTYSRIVRTISEVKNMSWGFGSCGGGCSYGGYGGYGYGGGYGGGSTFVLIVVLFILLIIVGASFYG